MKEEHKRVVTRAETETFVWLPINNIPRRSPKQATGMKYLLAKCNNWQWEPKSARSLALTASPTEEVLAGSSGRSFSDGELYKLFRFFYFFLFWASAARPSKQTLLEFCGPSEHSSRLREVSRYSQTTPEEKYLLTSLLSIFP